MVIDEKMLHPRKMNWIELSKKVKAISTKGWTKDLIDKFNILNGAEDFSLGIYQNYLLFIPTEKYIKIYQIF